MKIQIPTIPSSEITPQAVFENRRQILKLAATGAFGFEMSQWFTREAHAQANPPTPNKLKTSPNTNYVILERRN